MKYKARKLLRQKHIIRQLHSNFFTTISLSFLLSSQAYQIAPLTCISQPSSSLPLQLASLPLSAQASTTALAASRSSPTRFTDGLSTTTVARRSTASQPAATRAIRARSAARRIQSRSTATQTLLPASCKFSNSASFQKTMMG